MPNYLKPLQRCSDRRCGATDCPRCNPGCDDVIDCTVCGAKEYVCYVHELGWIAVDDSDSLSGLCPDCKTETDE